MRGWGLEGVIVDLGDGPAVDLGFKIYRALGPTSKLTPKDIVRLDDHRVRRAESATRDQLFTYAATVRKVIDGEMDGVGEARG